MNSDPRIENFVLRLSENPNDEEVVDTLVDAFYVLQIVENSLGDGFQIPDVFQILGTEPKLREISNDFPDFQRQLRNLTPLQISRAVQKSKAIIIKQAPVGKLVGTACDWLEELATSVDVGNQIVINVLERRRAIGGLLDFPRFK